MCLSEIGRRAAHFLTAAIDRRSARGSGPTRRASLNRAAVSRCRRRRATQLPRLLHPRGLTAREQGTDSGDAALGCARVDRSSGAPRERSPTVSSASARNRRCREHRETRPPDCTNNPSRGRRAADQFVRDALRGSRVEASSATIRPANARSLRRVTAI
jgi:hypothetical protein